MRIMTVKVPETWLTQIDLLVKMGEYPSRSEFVREAIRRLLREYSDRLSQPSLPRSKSPKIRVINLEDEDDGFLTVHESR